MSNKIAPFSLVLVILMLFGMGCGKPKVGGRIVFSDDQSPLTQGVVMFHGDHGIARGRIKSDGRYVVGSETENDGLPPGKYRISIKESQADANASKELPVRYRPNGQPYPPPLPVLVDVIDRKYEKPETSGLTVEIQKSQTFNFEVDRAAEKK